ncbi:MAG: tetratricopeptide repeat protein, partial [Rhodoferax sp.]
MIKVGVYHPCPCGSGKKYKFCCLQKIETQTSKPDQDALNQSGLIALKTGQLDTAAAMIAKAPQFKPDFADTYSNLGTLLAAQGKHEEAISQYENALRLKPDSAETHFS